MLFISFIDFGEFSSGSYVRPQKMYQAFKDLGFEVKLLSGQQNRFSERKQNVREILNWLDSNKPDFCYIETPSGPFFNTIDHRLLKKLKKLNIKTGIFYRDAFWLFPKWWGISGIKKFALSYMYRRDLKIFSETCDIIYFPSESMAEHFDVKTKKTLPPAGDNNLIEQTKLFNNAVYVGGVTERYGINILLKAFKLINEKYQKNITLTLICRENEKETISEEYRKSPWLDLQSASGTEELRKYYEISDIGIFAGKRDMYMDFAVPVKLFEYMSFGLPVVTTDCVEVKKIVEQYEIGIVTNDNAESLAKAVIEMYADEQKLIQYRNNVKQALLNDNLWINRAKTVAEDLTALKI